MVDQELLRILDYWNEQLAAYRQRVGSFSFEVLQELVGREIVETCWRDGEVADLFFGFSLSEHRRWAYAMYGRPWFSASLHVPAAGTVGEPVCEYDRPPRAERLRTPSHYVRDLELCPRPPELVPGWMKVELAAVGAWDLRSDVPTWKDYEPTGVPQTPESVGVPPPPGAEWALADEAALVDSGPIRGQVTYGGAGTQPGRHPVGAESSRVRDERGGMVTPWNEPRSVVPPEAMLPLRERWEQLASRHGPLVRVLEPDAGLVPGEESVGIAPALAAVVDVLPGVALGPIVIDWPQGASQTWPQLEDRHSYQPVWVDGREAVVVRVDPESGQAGEVLHVREDLGLDELAADVVTWWKALTAWAEERVPTLKEYAEPQAIDEEDLEMMLQEALEQEFADWLESAA